MKNKKTKLIIICFIILLVILIALLLTKKGSDNMYNPNISNSNKEALENINTTTNNTNQVIDLDNNTSVSNITNTSYKELLMDSTWVKENLYIKQSALGKEINDNKNQDLDFLKMNIGNTDKSILLVQTKCQSESSIQLYYILEKDGQFKVNTIDEKCSHSGHVEYIAKENSEIIYKKSEYMEGTSFDIYNATLDGLNKLCTIKMLSQSSTNTPYKYYYNDKECTEKQYNEIYNRYINDSNKYLSFTRLNEVNVKSKL